MISYWVPTRQLRSVSHHRFDSLRGALYSASGLQIVASYAAERIQHGAQTGVFMPVVRDGENVLDALFPSLQAKTEALGSTDYKSRVDVVDGSTGGTSEFRRSRCHAQPADQRHPVVQLEDEMGSMVRLQTSSGACSTFP